MLGAGFLFTNKFEMKNIHINNDDNYATPPKLYEELNKRFNFDFDPCPYNENEILNDGLKIEWGNSNFVNPPYSQKLKEEFVKRGVEEMKKGKVCVFLIPVSTSTKLFHEWIKPNATEIDFLKGRIKFGKLDKDGNFYIPLNKKGKEQSGTKDSMIVVFDGRSQACYKRLLAAVYFIKIVIILKIFLKKFVYIKINRIFTP